MYDTEYDTTHRHDSRRPIRKVDHSAILWEFERQTGHHAIEWFSGFRQWMIIEGQQDLLDSEPWREIVGLVRTVEPPPDWKRQLLLMQLKLDEYDAEVRGSILNGTHDFLAHRTRHWDLQL